MSNPLVKETAIATAKTACCYAIGLAGGHFGMLFLGALGIAGAAGGESAGKVLEFASEKASEIAAEVGLATLKEREPEDPLEQVFQIALGKSFKQIRARLQALSIAGGYTPTEEMIDWFENWDRAISHLAVDDFQQIAIGGDTVEESERRLRKCLALLNAQGEMLRGQSKRESTTRLITFNGGALKEPPSALVAILKDRLPVVLPPIFDDLLTDARNQRAMSLYVKRFIDGFKANFSPDVAELRALAEETNRDTKRIIEEQMRAAADREADKVVQEQQIQLLRQILVIVGEKASPSPAVPPSRKPFNLPYVSLGDLFKGREQDLLDLEQQLHEHGAAAIVQPRAITGMGGIGKTRLAAEYALRHQDDYSALLFVIADTPERLGANFALLSGPDALDLPAYQSGKQPDQYAAVLEWFQTNKAWLLILDNVDNPKAAAAVQSLMPKLQNGQVLITSRISQWTGSVPTVDLELLSEEASAEYLLERTENGRQHRQGDKAEAPALAEDLGRLALALEQAAAFINARGISFAEYRRRWKQNNEKLIDFHDEQAIGYPKAVAATFQTSFDQLSPNGRRLLNTLVWLAPEPVPCSLLEITGGPFAAESETRAPEESWSASQEEAETALVDLVRFSLVSRSADKTTFSVHRLVQAVTRYKQTEEEKQRSVAGILRWVNNGFPFDSDEVQFWPIAEALAPHALAVTAEADRREIYHATARLMNQLALFWQSRAEWAQAEPLYRRALAIDEKSLGHNDPTVAIRLNNLAELLRETNRLAEAEPLMRRALLIDEKHYGPDHPKAATSLNNLASLLQETNRLADAEPLMRRALAIDEKSYGPDHPKIAIRLNNLASLLQATNHLTEAEPLKRRALSIDEKSYGPDHPNVAIHLNNLAQLLKATNHLAEAEPLMRRALAIDEKSYGPDHPKIAIRLNNLASLLQDTNRLAEAEPLYRRALAIDEKSFGPDHPNVAIRLNNLALLLKETNRLAEAEPLYQRVIAIFENSLGPSHPNVAIALNNFAELLRGIDRNADAEPLYRRALAIDEKSYGPDHPKVAIRLNNLARLLEATGRLVEAEPLLHRAVKIFLASTRSTGHPHPHLEAAFGNYAGLLAEMGWSEEQILARLREVAPEFFK